MDKYKADVLSSTRKLKFVSQGKTIEVDVINARDQTVKEPTSSNLCALLEQLMVHHPEEPTEETFVGQVCVSRKTKYVIAFIYNAYGP